MINSTTRPTHINQFSSDVMQINILSCEGAANPLDIKNIDLTLVDDVLVQGVETLLVYGADKNDKISLQVVHPIAGVVNQFCTDYFIDASMVTQRLNIPCYTAKLPAGLKLRLVYKASAAIGIRDIKVNWLLHKVLV
jgi:hypothetical protein